MSLDLALFGLGPRRPVRASAPLRLRLATSTHGVDWNSLERIKWAADELADAHDAWRREQRTRYTAFRPPGDMQQLAAGGTRDVFLAPGGYVVKLARTDDYNEVNRREAQTWREAPAEVRRYLVPVLAVEDGWPSGRWLIMPYAPQQAPAAETSALCSRLAQRYPDVFTDCEYTENWRIYQGHARLIDYPEDLGQNTRLYAHGRKG